MNVLIKSKKSLRLISAPRFIGTNLRSWCKPPLCKSANYAIRCPTKLISSASLGNLLTENHRLILSKERELLFNLYEAVVDVHPKSEEILIMKEIIAQTESSFMLCVVGEFNAGKSTFINAMLGGRHVEEGVLPTTSKINILRKARTELEQPEKSIFEFSDEVFSNEFEETKVHVDWLDEIALVDTPGTNAVLLQHEKLTSRIIPRTDLVIFITSAERPFSDSERMFLERIKEWRKKVVLVLNKVDILRTKEEHEKVVEFVKKNGELLLGSNVAFFAVSARLAIGAKISASPNLPTLGPSANDWKKSGFEEFEEHMIQTLRREERIKNKILSPLGVAEKVAEKTIIAVQNRMKLLETDIATLKLVNEQMDEFMKDIDRELRYERLAVKQVFLDVIKRGNEFVDKTLVLSNIKVAINPKSLKDQFRTDAMRDIEFRVEALIADLSALVATRARSQSAAVIDFVRMRQGQHAGNMIGRVHSDSFEGARYELLQKLEHIGKSIVQSFNNLLQVAALQVGAATAGGLTVAHLLDPTGGLVAATGLALLGASWLPLQRRRAKQEFEKNVEVVQKNLDDTLQDHLNRELRLIHNGIMDGISPYSRFVRNEKQKAERQEEQLNAILAQIRNLRALVTQS